MTPDLPGHENEPDVSPQMAIPLVQEELSVEKRDTVSGRVRVEVKTDTFDEVARTTLERDDVEVTRVSVGKVVDRTPDVRTEGDTTIVPVMEETFVIEKRLVLKEELRITRRLSRETVETPVALRRQHVTVEHVDGAAAPHSSLEPIR